MRINSATYWLFLCALYSRYGKYCIVSIYVLRYFSIVKSGEEWLKSSEKRSFDILFSSAASALAMPLGTAALIAVMIENRHMPIFRQERIGNPDIELWVPKLRTLAGPIEHQPSQNGHTHTRAAGKLSRLVRKMHLDETPQFGLVLAGRMSVVGPRPIVKPEFEEIMDSLDPSDQSEWLMARKISKPGLVNGLSPAQHIPGYENSPQEVAAADIAYTQNASWDEDKRIILETTRSVIADLLSRRAASSSMNYDETALQSDHEVPIQPQVIIGEAAE